MNKIVNGQVIPLTPEEIEEVNIKESQYLAEKPERDRKQLKEQLIKDMSQVTVAVNGKVFWADPESEQNVAGRIREMESRGKNTTKWAQGLDIFDVTLDELKTVLDEGTKKNADLWDAYILQVENL